MPELPTGTVTFLFTDIEGSTRLWEEHPEAMREALARHDGLLRDALAASGGHIFKTWGDQFCAAFATAPEALEAALAAQRALRTAVWGEIGPLQVRTALHTGAVEARDGDYFGPPLNRVARLLEAGHAGQILLSLATQELTRDQLPDGTRLRDLGEHRLKDLARPERVFQLVAADLPVDFPPLTTLDLRPNNLPAQSTPLVGRAREITAARELLGRRELRLLTLTGPGGTGKTRLALQVAADLIEAFPHGVFFIDLAPITDAELVAATIAQTLGVRETGGQPLRESLKQSLQERQILLLLDNFEQVLPAAPLVAELLAAAPALKVLVTSRAPLHLRGEQEFPVPPLAVPDPRRLPSLPALSQYAAVELFIQRAVNVKPDFTVTHANAPAVAEICHRLEGLPLAIELAAARIKLLPPEALLARLGSRLRLLTGGARDLPARQQTLRNAIAWSYDLLDEGEKLLFRQLSVFVGGFTLEAVEAVCHTDDLSLDVLDGITSLIDKSLLRQEAPPETRDGNAGAPRFRMLDTLREFAHEQLTDEEGAALRHRHASYYAALAQRSSHAEKTTWLAQMGREHDNLRATIAWYIERGDADAGLRLAGSLWIFWVQQAHLTEGRDRLAALLALPAAAAATPARAMSLHGAGRAAYFQDDYAAAGALFEESAAIYRVLGDEPGVANARNWLGLVAQEQGDYAAAVARFEENLALGQDRGDKDGIFFALASLGYVTLQQGDLEAARSILEQALALARELTDPHTVPFALRCLGEVARRQGENETARALCEESLAGFRAMGDQHCTACVFHSMGEIARAQRDYAAARQLGLESLALRRERGEKRGIAECLESLAGISREQGEHERGARLFGAAAALREAIRAPLPPSDRESYERELAAVRTALGEAAFAAAWAGGRTMTLAQAVDYALGSPDDA